MCWYLTGSYIIKTEATTSKATAGWDEAAQRRATELLFSDLIQLSKADPNVFRDLYYNRGDELAKFDSILDSGRSSIHGGLPNVLIVGDAGVGKSNFMYRIATDQQIQERFQFFSLIIDYRSVAPKNPIGCKLLFIDKIKDYFESANCPIHTLENNTEANINDNVFKISSHLHAVPREKLKKFLVIFLDDFDYAECDWHVLLDFFQPFAASDKVSVVFSIRPPLIATIDSYDDRFRHFYLRNVQRIDLGGLNVAKCINL